MNERYTDYSFALPLFYHSVVGDLLIVEQPLARVEEPINGHAHIGWRGAIARWFLVRLLRPLRQKP